MCCIETKTLSHNFSAEETVLDQVNLSIETESIYGFLRPNGAGKTTTLKLIPNLLKKQCGEIFVFGETFEKNPVETFRRISSIESPSL